MTKIPMVLANRKNYGEIRNAEDIKYLVFHYTANDGDHDTANANYFKNNVVYASAHYFVDDDSITQSVPDLYSAYAVGGNKWSDCGKTGGGTMYGVIKNFNSISIEMCDTRRDGTLQATEDTMERAAALGRALMKKYNVPLSRVYRHFDVTGKHCPAYLMEEDKWKEFKKRLEAEEEMTYYKTIGDVPADYRPAVQKLLDEGALKGYGDGTIQVSEDLCRTAVILDRLGLVKGGV